MGLRRDSYNKYKHKRFNVFFFFLINIKYIPLAFISKHLLFNILPANYTVTKASNNRVKGSKKIYFRYNINFFLHNYKFN